MMDPIMSFGRTKLWSDIKGRWVMTAGYRTLCTFAVFEFSIFGRRYEEEACRGVGGGTWQ